MKTIKQVLEEALVRYEAGQVEFERYLKIVDYERAYQVLKRRHLEYGICYNILHFEGAYIVGKCMSLMSTKNYLFPVWASTSNNDCLTLRIAWLKEQIAILESPSK